MKKLVESLVLAVIVALPLAILLKMDELERKIEHEPVVYYQVDSEGAAWHGKVTRKEVTRHGYAVEVGTYGWFSVTKEQYENITVGDDAPEFLKKRGSSSNE